MLGSVLPKHRSLLTAGRTMTPGMNAWGQVRVGSGSPCRARSAGDGAKRGNPPACGAAEPGGSAGSWNALPPPDRDRAGPGPPGAAITISASGLRRQLVERRDGLLPLLD